MRLTVTDIYAYNYCPVLYYKKTEPKKLTLFEKAIKDSIMATEKSMLYSNDAINLPKLVTRWDKIWWPLANKNKMSFTSTRASSMKAIFKFKDYCKHEINSSDYRVVGINLYNEIEANGVIVSAELDIIKSHPGKKDEIFMIELSGKTGKLLDIISNPAILATAYIFNRDKNKTIHYTCFNLDEKQDRINIIDTATFRPKDIDLAEKMLYHTVEGIKKNIFLPKTWLCSKCRKCYSK